VVNLSSFQFHTRAAKIAELIDYGDLANALHNYVELSQQPQSDNVAIAAAHGQLVDAQLYVMRHRLPPTEWAKLPWLDLADFLVIYTNYLQAFEDARELEKLGAPFGTQQEQPHG
jgi:hypothetical protein